MEFIQSLIPYVDDVLAILGGVVIVLIPIAKWTKTTADDRIVEYIKKGVQFLVLHKDDIKKLEKK